MADRSDNQVISLKPRPNFTPSVRRQPVKIQLSMHPRTHHARELIKQTGNHSIEVKMPAYCPVCKSDKQFISEIDKDNKWWWSCSACGNEWEPIRKTT